MAAKRFISAFKILKQLNPVLTFTLRFSKILCNIVLISAPVL
jgi:hypothetical protein